MCRLHMLEHVILGLNLPVHERNKVTFIVSFPIPVIPELQNVSFSDSIRESIKTQRQTCGVLWTSYNLYAAKIVEILVSSTSMTAQGQRNVRDIISLYA